MVSVEVDPVVADTARRNLTQAGHGPLVVTGDGAQSYPPGALCDRMIATCSVQTVPYAWVTQTRRVVSSSPPGARPSRTARRGGGLGRGLGLQGPDCRLSWDLGDDGYLSALWLLAPDSWACVHDSIVRQAGTRRLFDEVSTAYSWWQHAGRPHRDRYGITITTEGQSVRLNDPTQPVTPRD